MIEHVHLLVHVIIFIVNFIVFVYIQFQRFSTASTTASILKQALNSSYTPHFGPGTFRNVIYIPNCQLLVYIVHHLKGVARIY